MKRTLLLASLLAATTQLAPCPAAAEAPAAATPSVGDSARAIDLRALPVLSNIIPSLAEHRVVFVGESHDQYAHHLVQLDIIRALHERHPDLAIGLEQFQAPFQRYLDLYVAGDIDERAMLEGTEYFKRWRFDYRLYRPILSYAREHGLPLVALNVLTEVTRKVADGGLAALSDEERAQLPGPPGEADAAYRERLRAIYQGHPGEQNEAAFERFVQAQLLWDEGMAARAAEYLRANPQRHLVVLAGSGHVVRPHGMPARLERMAAVTGAVVLNGMTETPSPAMGDFLVLPPPQELPPSGMLGILMESGEEGVVVGDFSNDSPARGAGIEKGDRLLVVDGRPVKSMEDVKLALFDAEPGRTVQVEIRRARWIAGDEDKTLAVRLAAP